MEPEELLGRNVGPYSIDRLIGQGGFAWVFAGTATADARPVALKILKPRYAGDTQFAGRFRNESQLASELKHPNIVRILEIGQASGFTFFSMSLYPDSLGSRLARDGPIGEVALLRIAHDVTDGLAYAHKTGIIHRDIKVDNILLADEGMAVIGDFGIARVVSGYVSETGVNMTIGTPQYISPEQAQGRTIDGRSDLYALGVTLYKAATGDVPFRSSDWFELARMHVEEQPVPPHKKRPDISKRLERVILKCLSKHPDDRYPSADAMLEELAALADSARRTESFGTAPRSTAELAELQRQAAQPRWLVPVIGVVVVIVVAVLVVVLGR